MYLSLSQAAKLLGYSPSTVRRLADKGLLPLYKATATSHWRVKRSDLEALLRIQSAHMDGAMDLESAWPPAHEMRGIPHKSRFLH